jgi:pyridoxamine 5'-phosphate oxidase
VDDIVPSNKSYLTERAEETESGATIVNFSEPLALFDKWYQEASEKEVGDHTAMTLATADADGNPSARMVLLKGYDEAGFTFYTNMESKKGEDILANPVAALCFHWPSLQRSIRIEGGVEIVSEEEANEYFASRPREARIGAWASSQSRILKTRLELEKRVAQFALKFNFREVPRPHYWTGCRVIPNKIEFWRNRPFRLHDRALYEHSNYGWRKTKLYP